MIEPIAPATFTEPNTTAEVVISQSHRDAERRGRDFWTQLTVDHNGQEILLKVDVHITRKPELEGYLTLTIEQTKKRANYLQKAIKSAEETSDH